MSEEINELLKTLGMVGFLSVFGGLVRMINTQKKVSMARYLVGILTAFFAGLVVHFLLSGLNISGNLHHGAVAIVGYVSRDFLDIISTRFLEAVKFKKIDGEIR